MSHLSPQLGISTEPFGLFLSKLKVKLDFVFKTILLFGIPIYHLSKIKSDFKGEQQDVINAETIYTPYLLELPPSKLSFPDIFE